MLLCVSIHDVGRAMNCFLRSFSLHTVNMHPSQEDFVFSAIVGPDSLEISNYDSEMNALGGD